jgi:hypothetical protein
MEVVTLGIAAAGLALAGLSLGWQAATFFMSGPRVKASLSEGFRGPLGVMIAPPAVYTDEGLAALEQQGYTEHVVSVTATNKGRLPTTVRSWSLHFGNRAIFNNPQDSRNPALPHRLEPHTAETWYAPLEDIVPFVEVFTDQSDHARTIRAAIAVATGETVMSRQRIVVGADGSTRTRHRRLTRVLAWILRKPLY